MICELSCKYRGLLSIARDTPLTFFYKISLRYYKLSIELRVFAISLSIYLRVYEKCLSIKKGLSYLISN